MALLLRHLGGNAAEACLNGPRAIDGNVEKYDEGVCRQLKGWVEPERACGQVVGCDVFKLIDEGWTSRDRDRWEMFPNRDCAEHSAPTRGKRGVIYYFFCLSRCFISRQHGHSSNSSYHHVSPISSLTMAISTASVVCCLRSPYRIPSGSSHIYRKLTYRQCSRVPAWYRKHMADVHIF
jgi:hypothetical protein